MIKKKNEKIKKNKRKKLWKNLIIFFFSIITILLLPFLNIEWYSEIKEIKKEKELINLKEEKISLQKVLEDKRKWRRWKFNNEGKLTSLNLPLSNFSSELGMTINQNFSRKKKSGIYLFFIDEKELKFDSDKLPIYVGKSMNIEKRWKEHYKKITTENCEKTEMKYIRIKEYRKDKEHNDVIFIILEEIPSNIVGDEEKSKKWLEEKERMWIKWMEADKKFSFNSINSSESKKK